MVVNENNERIQYDLHIPGQNTETWCWLGSWLPLSTPTRQWHITNITLSQAHYYPNS